MNGWNAELIKLITLLEEEGFVLIGLDLSQARMQGVEVTGQISLTVTKEEPKE